MHETMVAQGLMDAILQEASKQKAKPISAKIVCGVLNAINDEVLKFAFEAISKGTTCESVKLEIVHMPMQGKCQKCFRQFDIELKNPQCSFCGAKEFDLLPDIPITLETIEFETEQV